MLPAGMLLTHLVRDDLQDQWSQLAEGGGLECTSDAALQQPLASLLGLLGSASSVAEDQLLVLSDLVCTVTRDADPSLNSVWLPGWRRSAQLRMRHNAQAFCMHVTQV